MLQAVEVFCPAADAWRAAPPMACPRTSLAAAALGGRLYAVGGQDTRSTHASVEVFEPGAGRWVTLGAAMQHPRKYLGLAAAGGRLVAVGGMTGARMRLPAAEALDPREGRWAALPPMSVARSSAGVAALHECVYVVGGNVGMNINEVGGWCAWVRVRCVCGGGAGPLGAVCRRCPALGCAASGAGSPCLRSPAHGPLPLTHRPPCPALPCSAAAEPRGRGGVGAGGGALAPLRAHQPRALRAVGGALLIQAACLQAACTSLSFTSVLARPCISAVVETQFCCARVPLPRRLAHFDPLHVALSA